ncbi:outer membrane lipoprotein carrier protein LolA [Campylobacter ureolyticus]|uniref:Outer membrane lipoprotein carrier protein LolA n=1 Tax=Campylobacter ureolyticus TaxID=827 RepID=A0A2I1NC51_9BACT|nr:outer membrane lipoprotein carrier protein LolA [Campylobacter ureolyticus]PKZ29958.1 outer membrane lipoprotein carrier protein LolA [Campylobacter ureolyticus]
MKKFFLALFFVVLTSGFCCDEVRLKEMIKFTQVSGDFNQTKILKSFKNPIKSEGVFKIYDKTFEQNTTKPFKASIKVNKDGVFEYKDGNFIKINSNFDEELFLNIFTLNFDKLKQNFDYKLEFKDGWKVVLKPTGIIAKIFKNIEIYGKNYVEKIILNESNGDQTIYNFFNIK